MSSILDIDLDYFNLIENPEQKLSELLTWGDCQIAFVVEKHHKAYARWKDMVNRGTVTQPSHILHIDEHHDMMSQQKRPNIANFIFHAMQEWENCQVYWMVDMAIDSPEMWIDDDVWESLKRRFIVGSEIPKGWPKPNIVSICTSPEFINDNLLQKLLKTSSEFMTKKQWANIQKRYEKR